MSDQPNNDAPAQETPPASEPPPEHNAASLGRLFLVPLLIVLMIVGCSVMVILLFGWISESRDLSIDDLVNRVIEGSSRFKTGEGEKVLQVAMLPEDKELWQAAQELAERLKRDDPAELPPEKKQNIAEKLGTMLVESRRAEQAEMGRKMQQFLLQALGHLGQPESVSLLLAYALDDSQPTGTRRDAVGALVLMKDVPEAREAWPQIAPLLESPDQVLRVVATVAVGSLATPEEETAIDTLARASLTSDREVMWNATLALGRLGSDKAVLGLLDMLDRDYWEKVRTKDEAGALTNEGLSAHVIEYYLITAMDAAAPVGESRLREAVEKLREDKSLKVRNHAMTILKEWPDASTEPSSHIDRSAAAWREAA